MENAIKDKINVIFVIFNQLIKYSLRMQFSKNLINIKIKIKILKKLNQN
jgi:hypothetical protein